MNILHGDGGGLIDLLAHNIIGLYSLIFIAVVIATYVSFKYKGKDDSKTLGVLGGALLGLIPGCGGTVAVTSMYAQKKASFGAVVASFIATLGEGAFLLMVQDIHAYLVISAVGFVVALLAGYAAQYFNVEKHLPQPKAKKVAAVKSASNNKVNKFGINLINNYLFYPLMVIGALLLPVSILVIVSETVEHTGGHFFFDGHHFIEGTFAKVVGIAVSVMALVYWLGYGVVYKNHVCNCKSELKQALIHGLRDVAMIISIITIASFTTGLVIDNLIGEENLESFLTGWGVMLVILAALVGALPGCATYIIIIGIVFGIHDHDHDAHALLDHAHEHPEVLWGVLIAGGIATSGDGIFGLLAVSKEKAGIITLFSIILAIVVGVPIHLIFN